MRRNKMKLYDPNEMHNLRSVAVTRRCVCDIEKEPLPHFSQRVSRYFAKMIDRPINRRDLNAENNKPATTNAQPTLQRLFR